MFKVIVWATDGSSRAGLLHIAHCPVLVPPRRRDGHRAIQALPTSRLAKTQ